MQYVIGIIKNRRTSDPNPDDKPAELLKIIDNIQIMTRSLNVTYEIGQIPIEWLAIFNFGSNFKKQRAEKCGYYLISLMFHALKVFLLIIHNGRKQM